VALIVSGEDPESLLDGV
jgi:hypothetical protein